MHYSFSITINKKSALIFILIISTTIVIDSTIVKFFIFSYEEMSTSSNVILFATMAAIFALCSTLLLISVKKSESNIQLQARIKSKIFLSYHISDSGHNHGYSDIEHFPNGLFKNLQHSFAVSCSVHNSYFSNIVFDFSSVPIKYGGSDPTEISWSCYMQYLFP